MLELPKAIRPRSPATAPTRMPQGRAVVGLALAAGAVGSFLVEGMCTLDAEAEIVLAGSALIVLCLASLQLVTGLPHNTFGISRWRVGPWFLLWTTLAYGIASLTWLGPQSPVVYRISLIGVHQALVIVFLAVAMWTIGYLAGPPGPIRVVAGNCLHWLTRGSVPELRGASAPWLLYGVGTAARLTTI